jgi:hypothetical protein
MMDNIQTNSHVYCYTYCHTLQLNSRYLHKKQILITDISFRVRYGNKCVSRPCQQRLLLYQRRRLIPKRRVLLEKLTVAHLVKKFSTLCKITFTRAKPEYNLLSQKNTVGSRTSYFSKIHFNIILPTNSSLLSGFFIFSD